jgi:polysaccharide deacetylase 2 family uncharacterized protein YibQ
VSLFGGSRKRGGKSRSRRRRPLLVAAGVAAAIVVALLWIVRGREAPAPPADFGAALLELAATRGADSDRVVADEPIRKVGDDFVRSWQIAVPNRAAMAALADDIVAAASARGATVSAPSAAGDDTTRVRVDLGTETFDVLVVVAAPVRVAELAPTAAPTPRSVPTATPRPRPSPGARGRLAILLDDAGQTMDSIATAAGLPPEVGVAVLPFLPHSAEIAETMHGSGHEVWLHLPMEPEGYPASNPGPGAVFVGMADAEIRAAVHAAINNVPHAVGVNNHMGSRASADLRVMTWVMQELKARGLAFIDSRTSRDTVAEEAARALGVPAGRRHVFLDNTRSTAAIRAQLAEAVEKCRIDGATIAIGHLDPVTVETLADELPGLAQRGAVLVRPSALLR